MITKFGSLYAGHVDLDNIGLDGTPVNDRWLSDEHLASVFDKAEAIVTLMDRLGYDVFWAAEHRFQREGYECIPNLPPMHICGLNLPLLDTPPARTALKRSRNAIRLPRG